MTRLLIIFSLATIVLATLSLPFMMLQPGDSVVGGRYHITREMSLNEDISFYFAQVTVEEGAQVDGHIFLYSSTLDLSGNVSQNIHAFESDLTLRESARVDGKIDQTDFIHWTLLLPAMVQIP